MIFERKNVPVAKSNRTDRDYYLEFEGKEIGIFYYPRFSAAFIIDVDNMILFSYETIYNSSNCVGKDGLCREGIATELNEDVFKEIEEFYGVNLIDFGVSAISSESIDFPIG